MKNSIKIIEFYNNLEKGSSPKNINILDPYSDKKVQKIYKKFYKEFFNDTRRRIIMFGINPGRFGGGITGIPFTDPYQLTEKCDIKNDFDQKKELSSTFIYEMIDKFGGPKNFYNKFLISSICPYGFTMNNKNLNYYDSDILFRRWKPKIVNWIEDQIEHIVTDKVCIIIGLGNNQKFFDLLNKEYKFFNEIIALPHPRWILQYRSKQKEDYIRQYIHTLKNIDYE